MEGEEGESPGEELRMQLWVVTASRPVVGAQLQALASSPGEAAQTHAAAGEALLPARTRNSRSLFVFTTQAERSRARHVHAAHIINGNLNDGFQSFGG